MTERIVVGVDGSSTGEAALHWAAAEAVQRHADVVVLHTYSVPVMGDYSGLGVHPVLLDEDVLRDAARTVAKEAVASLGEHPGLEITAKVALGPAGPAIVDEATGASLVVVGARGLGTVKGLFLGSVSQYVAHHAHCPVVIVPTPAA